jgi:hypothetical protein
MFGIARRTKHANQITVDVTSMHAKASLIGTVLSNVSSFLKRIGCGYFGTTLQASGYRRF